MAEQLKRKYIMCFLAQFDFSITGMKRLQKKLSVHVWFTSFFFLGGEWVGAGV